MPLVKRSQPPPPAELCGMTDLSHSGPVPSICPQTSQSGLCQPPARQGDKWSFFVAVLCLSDAFLVFYHILTPLFFDLRIILDVQKCCKDKTESSHTLSPILYGHKNFLWLYPSGNFVPARIKHWYISINYSQHFIQNSPFIIYIFLIPQVLDECILA